MKRSLLLLLLVVPARLPDRNDAPAGQLLEELLKPLGARFVLRDEMVIIIPASSSARNAATPLKP